MPKRILFSNQRRWSNPSPFLFSPTHDHDEFVLVFLKKAEYEVVVVGLPVKLRLPLAVYDPRSLNGLGLFMHESAMPDEFGRLTMRCDFGPSLTFPISHNFGYVFRTRKQQIGHAKQGKAFPCLQHYPKGFNRTPWQSLIFYRRAAYSFSGIRRRPYPIEKVFGRSWDTAPSGPWIRQRPA